MTHEAVKEERAEAYYRERDELAARRRLAAAARLRARKTGNVACLPTLIKALDGDADAIAQIGHTLLENRS